MAHRTDLLKVSSVKSGQKKKKESRSPLYFFMMEKKQQWVREGRWDETKGGFNALMAATEPLWQELRNGPPHLMEPYIQKHREWKNQEKDSGRKYDAIGRPLADIEREAARQRKMVADMERDVENTVSGLGDTVTRASFFVAHFNYLCKTSDDFFPPCEAAVVEFSLERGVKRIWQEFLSPLDSVPEGYKYKCQQHARVTHHLTAEFQHYQTDYKVIMESLIQFLSRNREGKLPPIYVMPEHMDAAYCITDFIVQKSFTDHDDPLRVYSLPKLMFELHNLPMGLSHPAAYPSEYVAQTVLEDDKFSHHSGLGCDFHESLESFHYCSQSICQRLVLSLTATCNPIYNLGLRRNDHLPPNQAVTKPKIELSKCNYVKSERINRYVPTLGGITLGPQTFNPKVDVEHRDKDNVYFPGHMSDTKTTARAPVSWGGRPGVGSLGLERLDLTSEMMFPALSGFPGRDIRTGKGTGVIMKK